MIKLIKTSKLMGSIAMAIIDEESKPKTRYGGFLGTRGLAANASYIATETFFYMAGGFAAKLTVMSAPMPNGKQHWWVTDKNSIIYDVFAGENGEAVPYDKGIA